MKEDEISEQYKNTQANSCRAHLHLQTMVFVNVSVKKRFLSYKVRESTKLAKNQLCRKYFLQS